MMCVFCLVFLVISLYFNVSFGSLEANAILLKCEKGDSKNDVKRTSPPYHTVDNCKRKIRIFLNITNIGKTPDNLDYSFLSRLVDPETGVMMFLLNPVVLRLRQNQVLMAYPFHYLSAVNGKVSEVVVNYENTKNFSGCDDTSKVNPTCGLAHERGKAVPYSGGFCCFCPTERVQFKQTRGGQDCSLDIGDVTDLEKQKYKASAHCLKFDDVWYTVSALSAPNIFHETFMQVYNLKHLKNGSSVWVALTHDEDFELSVQNPYQFDENKTIAISYLTSKPVDSLITIPYRERRLLTPQQMPGVELTKLPDPVKNGANDYLLLPKDTINPDGDDCDVSGVSYEAFAQQSDRCGVKKDTCLKNQPLDFWEKDVAKRKSGGKGDYLLESFGTPYKDPIIIDPETKEHFLTLEYMAEHLTILTVEINADEIVILTAGKSVQISKIISSSTKNKIDIHVSVLNRGLMPAKFTIQAVKCGYGVADSSKQSVVIPPQMVQDVLISTKSGGTVLTEEFTCTVEVSSESYKIIAERDVKINPLDRCVCNFHCQCVCLLDKSLKCELMEVEEYHAAGFQGSLPVLTAKPPHRPWLIKHPFLAMLALILLLFLCGFIKGLLGLARMRKIGDFGMDKCLYQPKVISKYQELDLRNMKVVYDNEGYPINPDTKKRVRVIGDEWLFIFNLFFCFFWPCMKSKDIAQKALKKKKTGDVDTSKEENKKDSPGVKTKGGLKDKFLKPAAKSKPAKEKVADKGKPAKEKVADKGKPAKDKVADKGKPAKDKVAGKSKPSEENPPEKTASAERKTLSKGLQKGKQLSRSVSTLTSAGPVADPLNKELEKWKKGQGKIKAVTK